MAEMTPEQVDAFLVEPRDAVLSVVLPSGRAIGTPVWFLWLGGKAKFQSPTGTAKTRALRATGRASLCVHAQRLPAVEYVTLEGPVQEIPFDLESDIGASAQHYLGERAAEFMNGIQLALDSGKRWASFELTPTSISSTSRTLL
ncbi:MAG: pyridoxamine 5'-phosphate oxidase family protein [Acidimicrobiales bacterium]